MTGKAYPSDGTDMEVASVEQDQTGDTPKNDAKEAATELIVVKLPEAKKGSVLLPKHRLVERNFCLDFTPPQPSLSSFCQHDVTSFCQE